MLIVETCLLNANGFLELDPHKYLDVKYFQTFQSLMLEETTAQHMVGACISQGPSHRLTLTISVSLELVLMGPPATVRCLLKADG